MIKDVKSYIHTVGNRLSKAFSMETFGTEDQLEFWELSAEHFSRKEPPTFSEIVNWIDLLYRAPVHFVYILKDGKLILDRRHVLTQNILDKSTDEKDPHEENPQEKEYIRNFEHQLQNLEKKMDMDDIFMEQGISSHAIGQCEHIPLFTKEAEFWGIYCVGPYTKSPEQITPKLSIVSRILSAWLIGLDETENNPQKDYREKVQAVISDLGSGQLNTSGLAEILLRYFVHKQKSKVGVVLEFTQKGHQVITTVGLNDEAEAFLKDEGTNNLLEQSEAGQKLSEDGKKFLQLAGVEIQSISYKGESCSGMVLVEKTSESSSYEEEGAGLGDSFAKLLDYRNQNRSFSDQLMETYYQMLRSMEKRRTKTKFHTPRMVAFVQRFGMLFGLEDDEMEILTKTAKLHDIGYVGAMSVEPGKTIGGEMDHPIIGAELISNLAVEKDVVEGIRTHHEWINGNGTPAGLGAEEIPWTGKIVGLFEYVVDFIESNKEDDSKSEDEWLEALSKGLMQRADVQFDMVLIPTAIQLIQSLGWDNCTSLGAKD
tara:strand:+ start:67833 stop:69452 length:1620 start_codon:yes stop_codon:yes gene_type:complete